MTTYVGSAGVLKIDNSAGTLTSVAEVKNFTFDHTVDALDDTTMGSSVVNRSYKKGLETATGTAEVVYDAQELAGHSNTIESLALADDDVTFELYPTGDSSGRAKITFEGLVTGHSISSTVDDLVTATITFQAVDTVAYASV